MIVMALNNFPWIICHDFRLVDWNTPVLIYYGYRDTVQVLFSCQQCGEVTIGGTPTYYSCPFNGKNFFLVRNGSEGPPAFQQKWYHRPFSVFHEAQCEFDISIPRRINHISLPSRKNTLSFKTNMDKPCGQKNLVQIPDRPRSAWIVRVFKVGFIIWYFSLTMKYRQNDWSSRSKNGIR
jgi:hypothetical protein